MDLHREGKAHPAAEKGAKLHKVWEEALADGADVGLEHQWVLDYVRKKFTGLKAPELKLAVNYKFEPCDWKDSNVFYRAILDVLTIRENHANTTDYKTGKFRPKPRQGQEQVIMTFFHLPKIETATARFVWTHADNAPTATNYNKALDGERMIDELMEIPRAIEDCRERDEWPETPSPLCAYCPVAACRYNTNSHHD